MGNRRRMDLCRVLGAVGLTSVLGCGILGGNHPANPLAVGWGPPFRDSATLGAALEHRFEVMLKGCRVGKLDKVERSSVPAVLQQAMDRSLIQPVTSIDGQSSWNLFRYVSPTRRINLLGSSSFNDYLTDGTLPQFMLPRPDPGSSSVFYRQSCASVVRAALAANLAIPVASVKSAVESGFETHTELAIVQGRFFSPLSILLSPSQPRSARHRALLGIWLWYANRPGPVVDGEFFYLAGFNGVALYNLQKGAARTVGTVRGRAGLATPIGGVEADFSAALTQEASTEVESFETYLFPPPNLRGDLASARESLPYQVEQLPTPEEISRAWYDVQPTMVSHTADSLFDGFEQSISVRYLVPEIPPLLCARNLWEEGSQLGSATFTMVAQADTNCQVDIAVRTHSSAEFPSPLDWRPVLANLRLHNWVNYRASGARDSTTPQTYSVGVTFPAPIVPRGSAPEITARAELVSGTSGPPSERRWLLKVGIKAAGTREIAWSQLRESIPVALRRIECDGRPAASEGSPLSIGEAGSPRYQGHQTITMDSSARTISFQVQVDLEQMGRSQQDSVSAQSGTCHGEWALSLPLRVPFLGQTSMVRSTGELRLPIPAPMRR